MIYNPVQKHTFWDRLSAFYFTNRDEIDACLFLGVFALVLALTVSVA